MRSSALMLIRLGPCCAYAAAAIFLLSMVLLGHYPTSAWAWALYMTILPAMREPVFLLLAVTGIDLGGAVALLMLAALLGVLLALRPEQYRRLRFFHAHVALIATALGLVRTASAQAGLSGLSLPQWLRGDWSVLPITPSTLWVLLFALVSAACVCSHIEFIRRIRLPKRDKGNRTQVS